jgi:GxxExxY protein
MSTDKKIYNKDISDKLIGCSFVVYNRLGYGFLEKVYENSLKIELEESGINVKQQYPIKVYYKSKIVGEYRADLFINDCIIVELKAERIYNPNHEAQLLNYLKATKIKVGYIINFGKEKVEFKRLVF